MFKSLLIFKKKKILGSVGLLGMGLNMTWHLSRQRVQRCRIVCKKIAAEVQSIRVEHSKTRTLWKYRGSYLVKNVLYSTI